MNMHKVVIDTNILVSALLSPNGNPNKIYRLFLSGDLILVINDDIIAEYTEVIYRPHLHIPTDAADIAITGIEQYGEIVQPTASTFDMVDEDDRIFYDTAKAAEAYLITGNLKHYPNELSILSPAAFLNIATA